MLIPPTFCDSTRDPAQFNNISSDTKLHRRDALWQVEKAGKKVGKLLAGVADQDAASPLAQMDIEERLVSDYHGTGMTTGPHPDVLQTGRNA
jgi:hypothetical protein